MPALAKKTKSIIHISTNALTGCHQCDETIDGIERFEESVNHYLKAHGYKLLHVGQETSSDDEGDPWHSTVAVLGK